MVEQETPRAVRELLTQQLSDAEQLQSGIEEPFSAISPGVGRPHREVARYEVITTDMYTPDLDVERFYPDVMFSPETNRGMFIVEFRLTERTTRRYTQFTCHLGAIQRPGIIPCGCSVSWHDPTKYDVGRGVRHSSSDGTLGPIFYQALRKFGDFKVWWLLEQHFYEVFGGEKSESPGPKKRILEV